MQSVCDLRFALLPPCEPLRTHSFVFHPGKAFRTRPGLWSRRNLRTRSQGPKGTRWQRQTKSRFRRWPDSDHSSFSKAWFHKFVRSRLPQTYLIRISDESFASGQHPKGICSPQSRPYPTLDRARSSLLLSRKPNNSTRTPPFKMRTRC